MKLQLNENTLNAYINEAIRQELNEGLEKLGKLGGKASQRTLGKTIRNGAKKFAGNLSGRRVKNAEGLLNAAKKTADDATKAAQEAEKELKNLQKLKNQNLKQHRAWSAQQGPGRHYNQDLGDAGESLDKQIKKATTKLNKANKAAQDAQKRVTTLTNNLGNKRVAQTATRWGTGAAAAGFGAGYLAGRSGKNGQNPDAPWNDGVADPGMNGDAQDETGGNDGGFDGTFPWDNTTPNWTPRRPKTPTPAAEGTPAEPERPKTPEWAYQPVSTINGQTGVTGTGETQQGLKQHPENYVDSAKRVMLQTASAGLAGNTGNPKLDNWKQTNRNTRRTANDAIDTMRRDGAITRNQARQDKRALKDTEKMIRRNAKDMQNNY